MVFVLGRITQKKISSKKEKRVSFGFYNFYYCFHNFFNFFIKNYIFYSILLLIKFLSLETYLNYLFETIRNLKDIILDIQFINLALNLLYL